MRAIRIATRASKLAMTQSNYVKALLLELDPDLEITLEQISTKGDRDKSDFLYKLFIKYRDSLSTRDGR